MENLVIVLSIPTGYILLIIGCLLIIFLGILDASQKSKLEQESFKEPLTLSVIHAGEYFQVLALEEDKIQLKKLVMQGSANIPISYEAQQKVCIRLRDIEPEPDYWYWNSNIPITLRYHNLVFLVKNDNNSLDFEIIR